MISTRYRVFLASALISSMTGVSIMSGPATAATERIGVAAAVNPATTGTPPGSADRVIVVGDKMRQNERIVTSDEGRTQLLFLDGSALTIGPNSNVVLDEFVYDPNTKAGKLAFSATKGLFRLVGGKISKTTPVIFKTPTAVIGIRGGIGIITVREVGKQAAIGTGLTAGEGAGQAAAASGSLRLAQATPGARVVTTAQLAFGQMTVRSGGVTRAINIPGFQVVAANPRQAPSRPARADGPSKDLAGLEGAGGDSTGGATEAPTNEDVADSQLSELGSNLQPKTILSAPPAKRPPPPPPPGDDPVATQKTLSIASDTTVSAQQTTTLDTTTGTEGGVRVIGFNSDFVYGGRFLSQTPFKAFDFATSGTSRVVLRNENGSGTRFSSGFLAFTSNTDGRSFRLPVKFGDFSFGSSDGFTRFGEVSGTGFGAPDKSFIYFNLREAQFNNNPSSLFAGVAFAGGFPTAGIRAHDLFTGFPDRTKIPMLPRAYGGNFAGGPRPILYSAYSPNLTTFPNDGRAVSIYGSIAIDGVGALQRSAQIVYMGVYHGESASNNRIVLSGFSRGSVRLSASGRPIRVDGGGGTTSRDKAGNAFFGIGGPDYFVISSDYTTAGSTTLVNAAGFVQTLEDTATPAMTFFQENYTRPGQVPKGVGSSRTSQTLNGYVSGIVTAKTGVSTFPVYIVRNLNSSPNNFKIVTNAATNRLYATLSTEDSFASQSSLVIPLGNPSGASRSRQAFIDDNIFGVRDSTSSSPTVGGSTGTSRIALVTSAFTNLSGGLMNGISLCGCSYTKWGFISGEVRSDASVDRHRFHLVPWVAGRLSGTSVTASLTGTANYTGHVAANIKNGSDQYVALGNYAQSWNFSSRTGSASISNLDGASYTGSVSGVAGFSGALFSGVISGSGRTGSLQGAFMHGAKSNVGELGLQFQVSGGSYYAAGIGLARVP